MATTRPKAASVGQPIVTFWLYHNDRPVAAVRLPKGSSVRQIQLAAATQADMSLGRAADPPPNSVLNASWNVIKFFE